MSNNSLDSNNKMDPSMWISSTLISSNVWTFFEIQTQTQNLNRISIKLLTTPTIMIKGRPNSLASNPRIKLHGRTTTYPRKNPSTFSRKMLPIARMAMNKVGHCSW